MSKLKILTLLLIAQTQFLTTNNSHDKSSKDTTTAHHADAMPRCHNVYPHVIGQERVECQFTVPRTPLAIAYLAQNLTASDFEEQHLANAVATREKEVSPPGPFQRFTTNTDERTLTARIRFNPEDATERKAELQKTGKILADYPYDLRVAQLQAERTKYFWSNVPFLSPSTVNVKKSEATQDYRFAMMGHPVNRDAFQEKDYRNPLNDRLIPETDNERPFSELLQSRIALTWAYYQERLARFDQRFQKSPQLP